MTEESVNEILDSAVCEMTKRKVNLDYVIDCLIRIAVETGKVDCMCGDQLQIIVGSGKRYFFSFNDSTGRFRSLLARIYIRCSESFPMLIEGGLYGFRSHLNLTYGLENLSSKLHIETQNRTGFPKLIIEADE